ncbi:LysR family transcriptional regulator [Pseudonocardia zijingensis]|jgi:DNA-binding transcriptional LysR family regulator|uniref:LysR family transcriptional regulator n=1 Tax=Pseudonocardia zijingensis TaxID=153376 RepID=A0ABP3ZBV6_9PSEU
MVEPVLKENFIRCRRSPSLLAVEFDLTRLRILEAIGRLGSMTAAAEELNYSPSAVSQQMKRLASDVRTPVLYRHPKGVSLTEAGTAIVGAARNVQTLLRGLDKELDDLVNVRRGSVSIGVFPTFAASVLPEVLLEFRRRYPDIDLVVRSTRSAPATELLGSRDVDLALVWDYPHRPVEAPGIVTQPLMLDTTVLVLPVGHPLADAPEVRFEALHAESWIVRAENHLSRDLVERMARTAGFTPRIGVEAYDYPELQALVAAGFGVSICPLLALRPRRDDIVVKALPDSVPPRRIFTATLEGRPCSPAHRALHEVMKDVVALTH